MMRSLTLREHQPKPGVFLSREELRLLRSVAPGVAISPSRLIDDTYDLTPDSRIGAANLGSLSLVIRPKIPLDRVLFLMSYAIDPRSWSKTPFDFTEEDSLVEAMIPGFVKQVERAVSRGVLQGYQHREETLTTIRGRIRIADQIRSHYGVFPPADVEFDDFTDDIELNRLIKAAIWRFRKMRIRSGTARRSLQRFDASLADVEHVDYDRRRVPTVSYNRLNQHYRPAVELSRMILKSESIELESGDSTATSFFVDMNVVFENFVVVALREVLRLPTGVFPQNAQGKLFHLDRNRQVSLEPDLSWWDGGTCRFVGDVKYKPNVKGSDLYQLLAYVASADLPGGLLIYPEGEARPVRHEVRHLGRELRVMTINPQGTEEEILEEVKRVAVVIRRLRAAAIGEARAA